MATTDKWTGSVSAVAPYITTTNWNTSRNPPTGSEVEFPTAQSSSAQTINFNGANSPKGIVYSAISGAFRIGGSTNAAVSTS